MLEPAQLLERCNELRKAGGAKKIRKLKPGKPRKQNSCLIARNLNFDCVIDYEIRSRRIALIVSHDPRLVKAAAHLGWPEVPRGDWTRSLAGIPDLVEARGFRLPQDLTESAEAFDDYRYPLKFYAEGYIP